MNGYEEAEEVIDLINKLEQQITTSEYQLAHLNFIRTIETHLHLLKMKILKS